MNINDLGPGILASVQKNLEEPSQLTNRLVVPIGARTITAEVNKRAIVMQHANGIYGGNTSSGLVFLVGTSKDVISWFLEKIRKAIQDPWIFLDKQQRIDTDYVQTVLKEVSSNEQLFKLVYDLAADLQPVGPSCPLTFGEFENVMDIYNVIFEVGAKRGVEEECVKLVDKAEEDYKRVEENRRIAKELL